tara:strand:- start:194 stop:448 length:255 start_codon:yes stop_codon:yes gene_type:complete
MCYTSLTETNTTTLTLFSVRCYPSCSEYGCLFIIAAQDADDARKCIRDHSWVGDIAFSDDHTEVMSIGTAHDDIARGIVSEFTT